MTKNKLSNVVLVGMPGSGKSTIGRLLANKLNKRFVDGDDLIEESVGENLQAIVDAHGYLYLRTLEQEILGGLQLENTVLATGGSAVYSSAAMTNLTSQACCLYLRCSLETLKQRVPDYSGRGLAKPAKQTLVALYKEREPLYQKYADWSLDTDALTEAQVVEAVTKHLLDEQRC